MKNKIAFLAVVVAIIGLNISICSTKDTNYSSILNIMSIANAQTEGGYENCHENFQDCTVTDPITGLQGCGCEDLCDLDIGVDCTGPLPCYYSESGC
jgi:hypothetical protein